MSKLYEALRSADSAAIKQVAETQETAEQSETALAGVSDFESFLGKLQRTTGSLDRAAIGVCGVFGNEQTLACADAITLAFAQSTEFSPAGRCMRLDASSSRLDWRGQRIADSSQLREAIGSNSDAPLWWPEHIMDSDDKLIVSELQLIRELRGFDGFVLCSFDSLADVSARLKLAQSLDGIVVVSTGVPKDKSAIGVAVGSLQDRGVSFLGSVVNNQIRGT